jgi:spermidine/putrescine transport system ATP-binding protein
VQVPSDQVPSGAGGAVKVGVRPEKITISTDGGTAASGENSVTGLLRIATYIGVSHQYKVEGPGGTELTVYVQNLGAGTAPAPGDKVRLTWKPEHTFVVNPSDEPPIEEEEEA